jgi:hypothetical protein
VWCSGLDGRYEEPGFTGATLPIHCSDVKDIVDASRAKRNIPFVSLSLAGADDAALNAAAVAARVETPLVSSSSGSSSSSLRSLSSSSSSPVSLVNPLCHLGWRTLLKCNKTNHA